MNHNESKFLSSESSGSREEQGPKRIREFTSKEAKELAPEYIEMREDFRRNPELGFQEIRTSQIIAEKLEKLGFEVRTSVAKTGVIGFLGGTGGGPTIAILCNIDGLNVADKSSNVAHRSKNEGVSHSCGHDMMIAWTLEAAEILSMIKKEHGFKGNVKLIFQPNEERQIDPRSGALMMQKEGAVDDVDGLIFLHPASILPEGRARTSEGLVNAASGRYRLAVNPKQEDVVSGKSPDANTLLALVADQMGKYEPQAAHFPEIIARTTYAVSTKTVPFAKILEQEKVSENQFIGLKVSLQGPGGHAGLSLGSPNLNVISARLIARLYEKYGNALLTYTQNEGTTTHNALATKTDTWLTLKFLNAEQKNRLKEEVEQVVKNITEGWTKLDCQVETVEDIKTIPFSSEAYSLSTFRIPQESYIKPRREVFVDLKKTVTALMETSGLSKPKKVENPKLCPKGEWRLEYNKGTPPVINDPSMIKIVEGACREAGITEFEKPRSAGGNDLGYLFADRTGRRIPGCNVSVGATDPEDFKVGRYKDHHHPEFDLDNKALPQGAIVLVLSALKFLESKK